MRTPLALAALLVALIVHAAAAYAAPSVQIRRTEHGYPHIKASSWTGLGYGYRLPLRRGERIRRVRASVNGKHVKVRRVGRRGVRVSLRGRPQARYRIRIVARTSKGRRIRLDRRARTCTPAIKRKTHAR
jgi:hypothetical protein